jgi:hypothetical protein
MCYLKEINTVRGYCWGPSSSEGPQKRNLTMSSKHKLYTGTFRFRIKGMIVTKVAVASKLSSPHRFFYKPIVNVKGMTVISHRLCPAPINR